MPTFECGICTIILSDCKFKICHEEIFVNSLSKQYKAVNLRFFFYTNIPFCKEKPQPPTLLVQSA